MRAAWLVFLLGCGGAAVVAVPPQKPQKPQTPVDPLEADWQEMNRLRDWRSTVFASRAENPAVSAHARPIPENGPFRNKGIAKIRAYHFHDEAKNPPFTKDGRLDGAIVPGPDDGTLTDEERDRVLALAHEAESATSVTRLRCDFDPHHVLVMFDDKDVPVSKIEVCLGCGEVLSTPRTKAFGGDDSRAMTSTEQKTLREILDRHGLGAWAYGETARAEAAREWGVREYGLPSEPTPKGLALQAREHARPSGAPAELTPSRVSQSERDRFCRWIEEERAARGRESKFGVGSGYECKDDGPTWSFSLDQPCGPMCDVPFGRLESCMREFLNGPDAICQSRSAPKACEGLTKCLPHVKWIRP